MLLSRTKAPPRRCPTRLYFHRCMGQQRAALRNASGGLTADVGEAEACRVAPDSPAVVAEECKHVVHQTRGKRRGCCHPAGGFGRKVKSCCCSNVEALDSSCFLAIRDTARALLRKIPQACVSRPSAQLATMPAMGPAVERRVVDEKVMVAVRDVARSDDCGHGAPLTATASEWRSV